MAIKFQKYYVTDTSKGDGKGGPLKARVFYSAFSLIDGRPAVTLYAKDYDNALEKIFAGTGKYQNDSDPREDYSEKGLVRIIAGDPLYPAALARAEANQAKKAA